MTVEIFHTGEVQLIPQPLTKQGQQERAKYEEMLYSLLRTMSFFPLDKLIGKGIQLHCLPVSAVKNTACLLSHPENSECCQFILLVRITAKNRRKMHYSDT